MKQTATAFQAVNGTHNLMIGDNINSGLFIEFLIKTKILNSKKEETKELLKKFLEEENVQDKFIQDFISNGTKSHFIDKITDKLEDNNLSKNELVEKLQLEVGKEDSKDKRKISKIKSENMALNLIKEFHINIDEIQIKNHIKLRNLIRDENLLNKKIDNYFKDEKRIVMILDNYSVHISYLVRLIAAILNIKLIFLPGYSPNLNPIEQVWRTLKLELYTKYIKSEAYLKNRFTKIFFNIIDRPSFTKEWKEKYIAKN
jgi:transposase